MKTKAFQDGAKTGLKFDGSIGWDYIPGGPYIPKGKISEEEAKEIKDWWEGYNSTCAENLMKLD